MLSGVAAWYRMPFIAFPKEDLAEIKAKTEEIFRLIAKSKNIAEDSIMGLPDETRLGEEATAILVELRKKYNIWCSAVYEPEKSDTNAEQQEAVERAELITTILDRIKPIPKNAPQNVQDDIDSERQMLVMRAGWNKMPIAELRNLVNPRK